MPRKEEYSRMTPEQRERAREQRRAYKKRNPDKVRDQKRRYYIRYPERRLLESALSYSRTRERARAEADRVSQEQRAVDPLSASAQLAIYDRIRREIPRRLPQADRDDAVQAMFLAVLDGRIPVAFGRADIEAVIMEMSSDNGLSGWSRKLSLDEMMGDRSRGEAMGVYS